MEPELWAAVAGLALVLPAAFLYNRLVADRNQARQGYAAYEPALFTAVSEARAAALVEDHLQFARRFYNGAVMPFFETDDREKVDVAL